MSKGTEYPAVHLMIQCVSHCSCYWLGLSLDDITRHPAEPSILKKERDSSSRPSRNGETNFTTWERWPPEVSLTYPVTPIKRNLLRPELKSNCKSRGKETEALRFASKRSRATFITCMNTTPAIYLALLLDAGLIRRLLTQVLCSDKPDTQTTWSLCPLNAWV